VALESRKVDPIEVLGKRGITQNSLIEVIHDSAYGSSAAD
jgi:hypothetical protein